ncbi:MAG TPA: F0F1 ATP synthase subunit gamma [Candidatus Goldiibacteriota bacterium]|nr:F0F1 ATP synthase subunit gamma [Candidatus Goldiibacteriota bacterium]
MRPAEEIKRKLTGAESLRSIVRTMKILAAVNVRQYEKMAAEADDYNLAVEMGFSIFLNQNPSKEYAPLAPSGKKGYIILGSDMGMCGKFNELSADFALSVIEEPENALVMAVGDKVAGKLEDAGLAPADVIMYPAVLSAGIVPMLWEILNKVEIWMEKLNVNSIVICRNKPAESMGYAPEARMILPMDPAYLEKLKRTEWKSRSIPVYKDDREKLFSGLVKNYIYVALYRALVESLVSENTARLISMQSAEKHTAERIEELTLEYNMERQDAITSEILDIIAGAEAVEGK